MLIAETRWPDAWVESVGKGVIHFQQFWEHCVKVGVLSRTCSGNESQQSLRFCNETAAQYYIVPFAQCPQEKLMSQITWGKACLQLNKVETLQECADAIKSMDIACPVLAGASDPTKYMKKWPNCGYMTYHLWRHNTKRLKTAGALVEDLLPLFPDSKARLLPLLKDPDKTSAKAGFRFCHEKQLLATCLS